MQGVLRNEEIRGKGVCLLLFAESFLVLGAVRRFDEDVAFAVFEDVGSFVKEGEPEEVVGLAAEAELEDGFGWGEPASGAVSTGSGKLGNEHEGYAGRAAEIG